jgi:ABC-type ATPase involved in cell division
LQRVVRICRSPKVQEESINVIRSSEIRNWEEKLTIADKVLLHLARAFVANPEVLVVHKPTLVFDHAMSIHVMQLLQKFVRDRGLHVEGDRRVRHMRTCIRTTSS